MARLTGNRQRRLLILGCDLRGVVHLVENEPPLRLHGEQQVIQFFTTGRQLPSQLTQTHTLFGLSVGKGQARGADLVFARRS